MILVNYRRTHAIFLREDFDGHSSNHSLFFVLLALVGIICFFIGHFVLKRTKSFKSGYRTVIGVSILMLVFLFNWFQSSASHAFMGTIPWLFNQVLAIFLWGFSHDHMVSI
ncbi:hypothetical protein BSG1_03765 [Bacillus sp. SG-1]|nr:hypothetical protein BSG1_03765 [Bacillus sp. SG-1]